MARQLERPRQRTAPRERRVPGLVRHVGRRHGVVDEFAIAGDDLGATVEIAARPDGDARAHPSAFVDGGDPLGRAGVIALAGCASAALREHGPYTAGRQWRQRTQGADEPLCQSNTQQRVVPYDWLFAGAIAVRPRKNSVCGAGGRAGGRPAARPHGGCSQPLLPRAGRRNGRGRPERKATLSGNCTAR